MKPSNVYGEDRKIAHVGSKTACGAVITSGSSNIFVDVSDTQNISTAQHNYVKDTITDINWDQKLREIIDRGEYDIDNIFQKMCQIYIAHRDVCSPREAFNNIIDSMRGLFGRLFDDLSKEDQKRWLKVRDNLGNIRFGGRGELNYSSFDKLQHFLAGAYVGEKYFANVVGTLVELKDAITRLYKEYVTKNRKPHQIGYDMHDLEWTWAGGAFSASINRQSDSGIDKILTKFSDGDLILSKIYTSIMPNKDSNQQYRNNPNIDHGEYSFPNFIQYPAKAMAIDSQIKKMETLIYDNAK